MICPKLDRLDCRIDRAMTGNHYDLASGLLRLYLLKHRKTIFFRKLNIEQNDIGLLISKQL